MRGNRYKKGRVFVNRRWGTLVKITSYTPKTENTDEIVTYEEINKPNPRDGECFGDISRYLYDIDREIDSYGRNERKNFV